MNVAIIGARGQLGRELVRVFGPGCVPLDVGEVDICDPAGLREALAACRPEVVINTAAYHNVPECEKNADRAFAVNAVGVKNLRDACLELGSGLVQISTDYVFDGAKGVPVHGGGRPQSSQHLRRQQACRRVLRPPGPRPPCRPRLESLRYRGLRGQGRDELRQAHARGRPDEGQDRRLVQHRFEPDLCRRRGRPDPGDPRFRRPSGRLSRVERRRLQLARIRGRDLPADRGFDPAGGAHRDAGARGRPPKAAQHGPAKRPDAPLRPWQEALEDYLGEEGALRPSPIK